MRPSIRVTVAAMLLLLASGCGSSASTSTVSAPGGATDPTSGSSTAPTVVVSHGRSAVGLPGCTESGCTYIDVTLSGFSGRATCAVSDATWPTGTQGFVMWHAGDGTAQSPNYAGYRGKGYRVTVTCGAVTSKAFVW